MLTVISGYQWPRDCQPAGAVNLDRVSKVILHDKNQQIRFEIQLPKPQMQIRMEDWHIS